MPAAPSEAPWTSLRTPSLSNACPGQLAKGGEETAKPRTQLNCPWGPFAVYVSIGGVGLSQTATPVGRRARGR